MATVLNNEYADVIDELLIVDCRYPYEYDGGHITVRFTSLNSVILSVRRTPKIRAPAP